MSDGIFRKIPVTEEVKANISKKLADFAETAGISSEEITSFTADLISGIASDENTERSVLPFKEHFAAGLVEEIVTSPISVEVPITTHINGERRIIGRGKIAGGIFQGIIDNPPADEITEKIKRNMFSAVAMNFSLTPAIAAPVDSDGNIVFRKTY
jgi:hypothetical protein